MPGIAGQAMNTWASRGLAGQGANLATLGASVMNPAMLALLPVQSPKLMGALLYGGGRAADLATKPIQMMGPQNAMNAGLLAAQFGRDREEKLVYHNPLRRVFSGVKDGKHPTR